MQSEKQEIWVLGSKGHGADKEIDWLDEFPNFADFDVLIINTTSLTQLDNQLDKDEFQNKFRNAWDQIIKRVSSGKNGGRLLILIAKDISIRSKGLIMHKEINPINEFIMRTFGLKIKEVSPTEISHIEEKYKEYIDCKHCKVIYEHGIYDKKLFDIVNGYLSRELDLDNYIITKSEYITYIGNECGFISHKIATNKAGDIIAIKPVSIFCVDHYSEVIINPLSSDIFLLPIEEGKEKDSIDKLIRKLKLSYSEQPPQWISNIHIQGIDELDDNIRQIEKEIVELVECKNKLYAERQKLKRYYRLLWAIGEDLEDIVKDALELLDFTDIRKEREANLEDWIFDFKYIDKYEYGIIEVKGSNKNTSLENLTQCNKWVEDYMLANKKAKGIFITNKYRLEPYPDSKAKREQFNSNELEYAKSREICLIPSYVLFEAVIKVLNGEKPHRTKLEELIANTNGILSSLDEAFTS